MERPRTKTVLLAALAGAAGCSLVVDTSGLAGGPAVADGGAGDATAIDAETDGPADAGATDDDAGRISCTGHLFCDDFDAPDASLPGSWEVMTGDGNPLTLDPSISRSEPRSLRATVTPLMGAHRQVLTRTFDVVNKSIRFEFDYHYVPQAGDLVEIDPYQIQLYPPPPKRTRQAVAMVNYKTGPGLEHLLGNPNAAPTVNDVDIAAAPNQWLHVKIAVDFNVTPGTCRVAIDNAERSYDLEGPAPEKVELQLGVIYFKDVSATWDFRYDNVVVDSP